MYIYGYCYTDFTATLKRYGGAITNFCNERKYRISEVFHDDQPNRLYYGALKGLLIHNDILIISKITDLGLSPKEILNELIDLVDQEIRIMVLNQPETLFEFPQNPKDKEQRINYYNNVKASNDNIINEFVAQTQQDSILNNIPRNRFININGELIASETIDKRLSNLGCIKPFHREDVKARQIINACKTLVKLQYAALENK